MRQAASRSARNKGAHVPSDEARAMDDARELEQSTLDLGEVDCVNEAKVSGSADGSRSTKTTLTDVEEMLV